MVTSPSEVKQPRLLSIRRILCPVDFSEFSDRAYEYALSLAHHYGARLFVEHVIQPITSPYPYYAFPDTWNETVWSLDASADSELKKLLQIHHFDGVRPDLVVQRGLVPEAILDLAARESIDLIVMGTHGRQGLDRLAMGSVTERVVRRTRGPVLVVRKPSHDFVTHDRNRDPVELHSILSCTDFSDASAAAMKYSLSLAMEYNAELTLLHVLEGMPDSTDFENQVAQATQKIQTLVPREAYNWCSIKTVVRLGKPYQEIIQLALEARIDLVTMGVRGRNILDVTLFGSTTHRVIQLGSCPVLIVHS